MKNLIFTAVLALAAFSTAFAQDKLFTRSAKVYFNATADNSPETIEAAHTSGTFILEKSSGRLQAAVLIKGFYFERALMQEHFNENYMESSKFPKANFNGALTDLSAVNFAVDGTYNATVAGELTMHGVTKQVSTPVQFTIAGGVVSGSCNFSVVLKDYGIDIPSLVADKVGKVARISIKVESLEKI